MRHFVISAGLAMLAASACSQEAFDVAEPAEEAAGETSTPGITPGDPIPNDGMQQNEAVEPSAAPAQNEPGSGQ
jgi:hypothetical protein